MRGVITINEVDLYNVIGHTYVNCVFNLPVDYQNLMHDLISVSDVISCDFKD